MALDPAFLACSTQQIAVVPLSTHNAYGAPSHSSSGSTTYTAYVEPGTRVVKNAQGVEEVATATVYVLSTSATIGAQDKVTLPDGRIPKVVRVDTLNDDEGQHHLEMFVN